MKRSNIKYTTHNVISDTYKRICEMKNNYGQFHKCLFHLHTPASYDYILVGDDTAVEESNTAKKYKNFTERELIDLSIQHKLFPSQEYLTFLDKEQNTEIEIFENSKELLAYLLVAKKLIEHDIEMVLITDHNTISGYDKLVKAIYLVHRTMKQHKYPEVILGVEISCADKNHIVGIFKNNTESKTKITIWLNEIIMSEQEGTYLTSLDVMTTIHELDGLTYIAHINSTDMFKEKKFLSGVYKKRLFELPFFHVIGVRNKNLEDSAKRVIRTCSDKEFCCVIDADSHSIDSIGKAVFWLKGKKCDFRMIRDAFRDYNISIEYDKPEAPDNYIKGVLVKAGDGGFLRGTYEEQDFCLSFSEALNCFIGGRGTGKSTILNILEFVLQQRCHSKDKLEAFCTYPEIWVLLNNKNEEYFLNFLSPVRMNENDSVLRYFDEKRSYSFGKNFDVVKADVADYALNNYIHLYKLKRGTNTVQYNEITNTNEKRKWINQFFHRGYSINELVQTASNEKINQYIYETMFSAEMLSKRAESFRTLTGLENFLNKLDDILDKRRQEVLQEIGLFNQTQAGKLRITYIQLEDIEFLIDFEKIFLQRSKLYAKQYLYADYNISPDGVVGFLVSAYEKLSTKRFFLMLIQKKYKEIASVCNIINFCETFNTKMIDNRIKQIREDNAEEIIKQIASDLLSEENISNVINKFQSYITDVEIFGLEFNVNNKEDKGFQTPLYKDVRHLSLGQKVVAMLSFILGYSDFSRDYRPLIIDQPEDNLDNRYIYKNLVVDLRKVKSKRQVIIATHNATIVTNAKADQVVVLDSDGDSGFVVAKGFPNEKRIKEHIVNYLEGGIDSFKHKAFIYEEILK